MLESILKSTLEFCSNHGDACIIAGIGAYIAPDMLKECYDLYKEIRQKANKQIEKERGGNMIMRVYDTRPGGHVKTIYK